MKISCIMPVHNTAGYLAETVGSILAQTEKDFELICVDDASTDDSLVVLQELAAGDARVRVLHNAQSMGPGRARNLGFARSQGEFVIFLDSDDLFLPDLFARLSTALEQSSADLAVCLNDELLPNGTRLPSSGAMMDARTCVPEFPVLRHPEHFDYLFQVVDIRPWNKMVRKSLLERYGVRFSEGYNFEDLSYSWGAAAFARKIVFVDQALVTYRVLRTDSLTNAIHHDRCYLPQSVDALYDRFQMFEIPSVVRQSFLNAQVAMIPLAREQLDAVNGKRMLDEYRTTYFPKWGIDTLPREAFYSGYLYEVCRRILEGKYRLDYMELLMAAGAEKLRALLADCRREDRRVALWGCGSYGQQLLAELEKRGWKLDAVIDQNPEKQGTVCCGYTIQGYAQCQDRVDVILITNPKWLPGIRQTTGDEKQLVDLVALLQ